MGKGSIFLEGPEDDSIRIETCSPSTIINTTKFCCLTDTSVYLMFIGPCIILIVE